MVRQRWLRGSQLLLLGIERPPFQHRLVRNQPRNRRYDATISKGDDSIYRIVVTEPASEAKPKIRKFVVQYPGDAASSVRRTNASNASQDSPIKEHQPESQRSRSTKSNAKARDAYTPSTGWSHMSRRRQSVKAHAHRDSHTWHHDTKPGKSLLEALFPEEAAKQNLEVDSGKPKRSIPRLPIEPIRPLVTEYDSSTDKKESSSSRESRSPYNYNLENREEVVLRIYGTSKYLSEGDFRRVSPGGKHIEGWQQDLGNIERIIPGRNPSTLEREESYCLVFSSAASAKVYQQEAVRLHQLAATHTPTSLISMIPLPPGFQIDGEDAHAKLQSYALYPPSLSPDTRFEYQPFQKRTLKEVLHRDYNPLMRRPRKEGHEVLLSIDGPQPTVFDVRTAISKDGVNRGLPWAVLPGPENGVTQLKLAISLHGEMHRRFLDTHGDEEDGSERKDHCRIFHKWVVAFQTDAEAKRFIRAWHKMPLPTWWSGTEYEEVSSIVNVELLWKDE